MKVYSMIWSQSEYASFKCKKLDFFHPYNADCETHKSSAFCFLESCDEKKDYWGKRGVIHLRGDEDVDLT